MNFEDYMEWKLPAKRSRGDWRFGDHEFHGYGKAYQGNQERLVSPDESREYDRSGYLPYRLSKFLKKGSQGRTNYREKREKWKTEQGMTRGKWETMPRPQEDPDQGERGPQGQHKGRSRPRVRLDQRGHNIIPHSEFGDHEFDTSDITDYSPAHGKPRKGGFARYQQDLDQIEGRTGALGRSKNPRINLRGPGRSGRKQAERERKKYGFGEPMRNFNDDQFLLFFANQYPEAFQEVAGEFHEFVDWKGAGRKALQKTADVVGPHVVRGLHAVATIPKHISTLTSRPSQYAHHVGETLGQGAKDVIQGVGTAAKGVKEGVGMAAKGVVRGARGFVHGKERTDPSDMEQGIMGSRKAAQRLGGEHRIPDYSAAQKRDHARNPEYEQHATKSPRIREHGKHKTSEFSHLNEFSKKRKVAMGKKMLRFMEEFHLGILNGGEKELMQRVPKKDIPPAILEKFSN